MHPSITKAFERKVVCPAAWVGEKSGQPAGRGSFPLLVAGSCAASGTQGWAGSEGVHHTPLSLSLP